MFKYIKSNCFKTLAASAILAASASTAFAADNSIAIVDTQKIFEKATALTKIKDQLDKKAEEYKTESSKKEDYFKKKFDDLEKQKSILSNEAFEKKSGELSKEFAEAQKKVQDNRQKLDKAYVDAMQQVNDTFSTLVSDEAKKKGYQVVMPKLQTLFSDNNIEITDQMIKELNKKLPTVKVNFS